ncbi:hypothetical protein BZG35_08385 [Brevundimonas sp. LM2]|uniref:TonB-dependent siderophore receptor n=1 Tax=Brevundimonas sp. LM2 TaxID=1938605 RepID=UPI000983B319|nr:TonB-dependent receptor [Brevundimonas sp. LM2]AQR61666.1 hypothetical protein BZG35_08385 [Brevundimonas sp. LM2]
MISFRSSTGRAALLAFTALTGLAALPSQAAAQSPATAPAPDRVYDFDIPAQSLARSVSAVSALTGLQVLYTDMGPQGVQAPAVRGRLTADQALARLTAGTGFRYRYTGQGVVTLEPIVTGSVDGERVLGPVRVEGAQSDGSFGRAGQAAGVNGVNGSRDITATEGTGSFTSGALTIGSKAPRSIQDTPQSVSVITSERLEQQNINDFTQALQQAPGVTVVQGQNSIEELFYSRGFEITSIQVDGGAPLSTSFAGSSRTAYFPEIDLAQYDHIEILRGAAGLFNGYGDPSGTVNLVRKKPLDHAQVLVDGSVGSWEDYRTVLDVTGPLGMDGKLAGRLVLTYQDNGYFYDTAENTRSLIYGIVSYDLNPSTVLTVGLSHTRQDSVPWSSGLPRYQDGSDLMLPRNRSLLAPWSRWNFETSETFATVEQRIGESWTVKVNFTNQVQESIQKLGFGSGTVNPLTNTGSVLTVAANDFSSSQFSGELSITGAFNILGQRQEMAFGINGVLSDGGGTRQYSPSEIVRGTPALPYRPFPGGPAYCSGTVIACPNGSSPQIDVFNFNPQNPIYSEPSDSLPSFLWRERGQEQLGAYLNLDLTALQRIHLAVGFRYSYYKQNSIRDRLCVNIPTSGVPTAENCVGREIGDAYAPEFANYDDTDFTWPPAFSLSYDLSDDVRLYADYTDIYVSQANNVDGDRKPVHPITGSNLEAGAKWSLRDGKLNASVAVYRIDQQNFAIRPDNVIVRNADGSTFFDPENEFAFYVLDNAGNRIANGEIDPETRCCYVTDFDVSRISKGIDVEITGEVIDGLNIAASYTYNDNEYKGDDLALAFFPAQGTSLITRQPNQLFKLWASYNFASAALTNDSWLNRINIGGGVSWLSEAFVAGTACTQLGTPNALGSSSCLVVTPYSYTQPSYAVWSLQSEYTIDDNWRLQLNIDNLTDTRYYSTMGTSAGGNWYGEPANFSLSLRGKF